MIFPGSGDRNIRQESGWQYMAGIALVVSLLGSLFLYYYIGPDIDDMSGNIPAPTDSIKSFRITIDNTVFEPVASFTVYPHARRDQKSSELSLYALLPDMQGYTKARHEEFVRNTSRVRRVDMTISKRDTLYDERQRIENLYLPQTVEKHGISTPYQLTKFTFRDRISGVPTSGFTDRELYVGTDETGKLLALFCYREQPGIISPECWREYSYNDNIEVSYRFGKAFLPRWKSVDNAVRHYIAGLDRTSPPEVPENRHGKNMHTLTGQKKNAGIPAEAGTG